MDKNKLDDALYDKMAEEQQEYRAWLMAQPPDEILDHAAEFTIREDILVEMEALDLPAEQVAALLASPTPLADLYREWSSVETHHMEDIRDVIEDCTEKLAAKGRTRERCRSTPGRSCGRPDSVCCFRCALRAKMV